MVLCFDRFLLFLLIPFLLCNVRGSIWWQQNRTPNCEWIQSALFCHTACCTIFAFLWLRVGFQELQSRQPIVVIKFAICMCVFSAAFVFLWPPAFPEFGFLAPSSEWRRWSYVFVKQPPFTLTIKSQCETDGFKCIWVSLKGADCEEGQCSTCTTVAAVAHSVASFTCWTQGPAAAWRSPLHLSIFLLLYSSMIYQWLTDSRSYSTLLLDVY